MLGAVALAALHVATALPPCRPFDAFGGAAVAGAATIGFVGPALAEAAASAGPDASWRWRRSRSAERYA